MGPHGRGRQLLVLQVVVLVSLKCTSSLAFTLQSVRCFSTEDIFKWKWFGVAVMIRVYDGENQVVIHYDGENLHILNLRHKELLIFSEEELSEKSLLQFRRVKIILIC